MMEMKKIWTMLMMTTKIDNVENDDDADDNNDDNVI